jgi:transcriptional regulator with XRE-family HTH domain
MSAHSPKVKYPSPFLKERRTRLGLDPHEVAAMVNVPQCTYRQWECRGELPEAHFSKLATALQVSENELKAEKVAAMIQATLGISKEETHGFIAKALRK